MSALADTFHNLSLDTINGLFEFAGAYTNLQNVRAIRRDRRSAGVSWQSFAFFGSWGLWNLYYYPALGQWLSFAGGCAIVSMNLAWVGHYFYYRWQHEQARLWQ